MNKLLIIAEHDNQAFSNANRHILTAANALQGEVDMLIAGYKVDGVVSAAKQLAIKTLLVADHSAYEHQLAENISQLIADVAKDYQYILVSADTFGKNVLPRVAALLNTAMIADVVKIIAPDTFVRPIYAGNALTTVQSLDAMKILSIRSTAFSADETKSTQTQTAVVKPITTVFENSLTTFVKQVLSQSVRPDLGNARIVLSGGRGLKSADNFKLLEDIADILGAAIGASRAAVDAGFAPNDYQVGQTGKVIAPDLYIAVGISGAIQHMAGMKDSKVIVAINNDPNAPIFEYADYGLVGDLFQILPELKAEFAKQAALTS